MKRLVLVATTIAHYAIAGWHAWSSDLFIEGISWLGWQQAGILMP